MTRTPLPGLGAGPSPAAAFNIDALFASAVQAQESGRAAEAERSYRLLLGMAPKDARIPAYLAVLLLEQGRNAEALPILDQTLALDPGQAGMHTNKGNALMALDRVPEALAAYGAAIALQPRADQAPGYVNLGVYLESLKRPADAAEAYLKAIKLDPSIPEAWGNLGIARLTQGHNEAALEALDRAIKLRPAYADAWTNRGTALQAMGRLDEALASFDRALDLTPGEAGLWSNRSLALQAMGRTEESLEASTRAVALDAQHPESLNNHGVALQAVGRGEEAMAAYDKAVSADPTGASAWNNRGLALQSLGRFEEARASFDRAIALKPDFPDALWNKSLLLIALGEYAEGWKLFEWRWTRSDREAERLPDMGGASVWLGETSPKGKRVLIHAEQGFGDTLCMLRYAPVLAAQGAQVIVNAPVSLHELVRGVEGVEAVIGSEPTQVGFDLFVPTMSLPAAMGTTLETLPAEVPYLHAPAELRAKWAARLGPKTRRRVGLTWSGNAKQRNDHNRSMPLANLLPLLDADVEFHSLQKDYRPADRALLEADGRIIDHAAELESFADTAALMEEMDLVISVCTSTAHLAGALARPLLVMLTAIPDYRWGLGRTDSPWYPTARLLRQKTTGDWSPVIAGAKEALDALK